MSKDDEPTLIRPGEVLKLLPFVSRAGLYAGSRGTSVLTRFSVGGQHLYSLEEVEALKRRIVGNGKAIKARDEWEKRKIPTEVI